MTSCAVHVDRPEAVDTAYVASNMQPQPQVPNISLTRAQATGLLLGLGLAAGMEFYTFNAINLVLVDLAGSLGVSRAKTDDAYVEGQRYNWSYANPIRDLREGAISGGRVRIVAAGIQSCGSRARALQAIDCHRYLRCSLAATRPSICGAQNRPRPVAGPGDRRNTWGNC